jgi:hypothetical protein
MSKSFDAVARYEYATTHGSFASYYDGELEHEADAPEPPAGDGWELVCMAASSHRLYWSWRRKAQEELAER